MIVKAITIEVGVVDEHIDGNFVKIVRLHQLFEGSRELIFGALRLNLMSCHNYLVNCITFWRNLLDKCTKMSIVENF